MRRRSNKISYCGVFWKRTSQDTSELLSAEIENCNKLIGMGRYGEAVEALKLVVLHDELKGGERATAIVSMARAFCYQEKFEKAKKCLEMAQKIFGEKNMDTISVAVGFWDMSVLYEKMQDYETAISFMRRALTLPNLPLKLLAQIPERFFLLISLNGSEKQGAPYLEYAVERMKESFGPSHCEVGYAYQKLGMAYMKIGQSEMKTGLYDRGTKCFERAKDILQASLGPNHLDSLSASQSLSLAYATTRSYDLALSCQQEVVEGLERFYMGQSNQDRLDGAVELLNHFKVMANDSQK